MSVKLENIRKLANFKAEKMHLVLLAVLVAVLPWFKGGQEGIAVAITVIALLLGTLMVWRLPKRLDLPMNAMIYAAFGLLGWGALSLVWTVNRYQTMVWVLSLAFGIVTFWLAHQLQAKERWMNTFLDLYTGAAAMVVLYGVYLYWTDSYDRLTSSFFWPNPLAAWLLPAVIIAGWRYAEKGRRQDLLTATLALAGIWLTVSRSSLLLLGLVVVLMACTIRRKGWFWTRLGLLAVLTTVVALGIGLGRHQLVFTGSDSDSISSRFADATSGQSLSIQDRLMYLRSSVDIWKTKPLTGTGAGTFPTMHPKYQGRVISASSHAHDVYAETLADLGAPGFLLLAALAMMLIWYGWLGLKRDHWKLPLFVGLVLLLVHAGLDFDTSYPAMVMLIAALGGLTIAPGKVSEDPGLPLPLLLVLLILWPAISLYQADLLSWRGHAAQDSYDYFGAIQDFNAAHQQLVYDPDVISAEGINFYTLANGDYKKAESLAFAESRARAAIKQDTRDSQHYSLLGRVLLLKGDDSGAESAFKQALADDSFNHPEYYEDLMQLLLKDGRALEAKQWADQALARYTDDVLSNRHFVPTFRTTVSSLYTDRAIAELAGGDRVSAEKDLKKATDVNPKNRRALQLRLELR